MAHVFPPVTANKAVAFELIYLLFRFHSHFSETIIKTSVHSWVFKWYCKIFHYQIKEFTFASDSLHE